MGRFIGNAVKLEKSTGSEEGKITNKSKIGSNICPDNDE